MTIKELENRTGMTRANIRFYEGEDLLHPKRLENGYRDYSEEDALTLEKIKLLRQLQLDIDTIRKVQQGALTLEQALFTQLTRLEGDKAIIERAAEVCRELEASGVEYAALEPQPWLTRLEPPPAQPALSAPPPRPVRPEVDDTPKACYHPWMRYFARVLDMNLYSTAFDLVWLLGFHSLSLFQAMHGSVVGRTIYILALLAFTLAVEPLWLHFLGWTPGKWVFGLKLRDEEGKKLSLARAWARSWRLAWEGYGWNIPIYNLWRLLDCRKDALNGWNGGWNGEQCRYTKEERRFSGPIFAGVLALCTAALFFGTRYAILPPCRGDLSAAELARNYNHFRAEITWCSELPQLSGDGRWGAQADGYGYGATVQTNVNGVWVELEEPVWDEPEFTLEDGHITAVTLRVSGGCIDYIPSVQREILMLLALSGATESWSLLDPDLNGWLITANVVLEQFGDGETEQRGLRVAKRQELSGYEETEDLLILTPIVGEEQHYERVITISLIQ